MSEVNTYKKITDVELVSALNDAVNVLINDNGALKQLPVADAFATNEQINELSEKIAEVDYGISFTMQNNKVTHSASFNDVAKVCLNNTQRADALLNIIHSLDMTTMQLTISAHRSIWFKAVRDLTTNSIIAMQWGFIVDGAEVVYQFNPDGTVTEVTE